MALGLKVINSLYANGTQVSWLLGLSSFLYAFPLLHRLAFTEVGSGCGRMSEQWFSTALWLERTHRSSPSN